MCLAFKLQAASVRGPSIPGHTKKLNIHCDTYRAVAGFSLPKCFTKHGATGEIPTPKRGSAAIGTHFRNDKQSHQGP